MERYTLGVTPYSLRKVLMRYAVELKPVCMAISVIRWFV